MVPYQRPIPDSKPKNPASGVPPQQDRNELAGSSGLLGAWVQAEKMIQVALMLPCAGFLGWLAGAGLDRWLHLSWMGLAGAVFGIIAGLVGAIRMAMIYASDPNLDEMDKNGKEDKDSGSSS